MFQRLTIGFDFKSVWLNGSISSSGCLKIFKWSVRAKPDMEESFGKGVSRVDYKKFKHWVKAPILDW